MNTRFKLPLFRLFGWVVAVLFFANAPKTAAQCNLTVGFTFDPNPVCYGDLVTFTAVVNNGTPPYTYAWTPPNGAPIWSNTNTLTLLVNDWIDFVLTVTDDNGCTGSQDYHLKPPLSNISPVIEPTCLPGQPYILSVDFPPTNATFLWSTGQSTPEINGMGGNSYSVTLTVPSGCTRELTYPNLPIPPPVDALISGPSSICQNSSGVLTTLQGNPWAYAWSNGSTDYSTSINSPGTYGVTVTNQITGCTASDDFTVVPMNGTPPAMNAPLSACPNSNNNLIEITNSGIYSQFNWSTGQNTPSIFATTNVPYSVTVTEPNGCTATASGMVNAFNIEQAMIEAPPMICDGQGSAQLGVVGQYQTYSWSNGETSPTMIVSQGGIYSVTVTDANGCTSTASQLLDTAPLPTPSLAPVQPFCEGDPQVLTVGGGPFFTYQWSTGETSPDLEITQAGNYAVTVSTVFNCTGSASVAATTFPSPNAAIATAFDACNSSATLTASGGGTYVWSTGTNGSSITTSTSGTYSVTVTNSGGCTATDSETLVIPNQPQLQIDGPANPCQGNTASLTASAGFSNYHWSNGDTTQTSWVTQSGDYTLTVTNSNGCTSTGVFSINFVAIPPVNIQGPTSICTGSNAVLSASGNYNAISWSTGETTPSINVSQPGGYLVTVSNSFGCTAIDSLNLTVSDNLVFNIGQMAAGCSESATLSVGSGFESYSWSNGDTLNTINITQSGTYAVTIEDGFGCIGADTIVVNALPMPPSISINGPSAACPNVSTILTADAGFSNYFWSTGSASSSIIANQSGVYSVTATDSNGCTASASQTFSFWPSADVAINGPTSLCTGTAATLIATGNFTQLIWNTGVASPSIEIAQAGNYAVTVTSSNGCTASASQTVIAGAALSPIITQSVQPCSQSAGLDAGTGYEAYIWSNGETTENIIIAQSGNYTVTVSEGGCSGTASANILIPALSFAQIQGPSSLCTGGSASLSVAGNFQQILWNTGETGITITATQPGAYAVTTVDNNGCPSADTMQIIVVTSLSPQISSTYTSCNGTAILDAGAGYFSYQWSNGETTQAISVNQAGNYSVTVSDSSTGGCTGTDFVAVIFPNLPQVQVLGPTAICEGTNAVYSLSGSYPSMIWSTGDSGPSINVSTPGNYSVTVTDANGCTAIGAQALAINSLPLPSITASIIGCTGAATLVADAGYDDYLWSNGASSMTISANQSGNFTVTVTDANNCSGTGEFDLNLPMPPIASISGPNILCEGYTAILDGTVGMSAYHWTTGETTPSIIIAQAGSYGLTVTDANGCTATSTWSVSFQPTIYSFYETTSCNPMDTGVVVTNFSTALGCDSIVSWTTNLVPAPTSQQFFAACVGEIVHYQGAEILAGTTQDIYFTTAIGCDSIVTITVLELHEVGLDWSVAESCWNGSNGTISLTPVNGILPYSYSIDGSSFTENAVFDGLASGTYSVIVKDANGCSVTIEATVPSKAPTVIALDDVELKCSETTVQLMPNIIAGEEPSISWLWSTGASTKEIEVTSPGNYALTVDDGCEVQTITAEVTFSSDLSNDYFFVPSSFSPNDDGINDYFMALSAENTIVRKFEFKVFDRWGNSVFSTADHASIGWDGLHRSAQMKGAVFVWYLKAIVADCFGKDLEVFQEGGVTLMR